MSAISSPPEVHTTTLSANQRSPRIFALLSALLLTASVGCGESMPGPGDVLPTAADMATNSPNDLASDPGIAWPGTWNVQLAYSVACTFGGAGQPNRANPNHTNTMVMQANGASGLLGMVAPYYEVSGTGTKTGLTLSGKYPVRDFQGSTAGAAVADMNMVTIQIDKVVSNQEVTGTLSGTFKTIYTCTIESGTVKMTR